VLIVRGDARTVAHARAVAALTARVRREHPRAVACALESAATLLDAIERMAGSTAGMDALPAVVAIHRRLTATHLADLPDPSAGADEVITAVVFLAAGIDDLAAAVTVRRLSDATAAELPGWASPYRVAVDFGDRIIERPVPRSG
jgi:hypothetical protein